jgi:small subunit ribosomal protein S8
MSVTDPIADMLTRMRNAQAVRKRHVLIPGSKLKVEIARVLKSEGYIEQYELTRDRPQPMLRVQLKYAQDREPALTGLLRVSKPGRRVYSKREDIPLVLSGMGIAVMSTPKGVMTGKQAHRAGVGGEVLCYFW